MARGTRNARCDAMNITESTECRMLTLGLGEWGAALDLNTAAALIRQLPLVLRVRVDLQAQRLEILHQHPAAGLIQKIHLALLMAGRELRDLRDSQP